MSHNHPPLYGSFVLGGIYCVHNARRYNYDFYKMRTIMYIASYTSIGTRGGWSRVISLAHARSLDSATFIHRESTGNSGVLKIDTE